MSKLSVQIESLLLVGAKPIRYKELASLLKADESAVKQAVGLLKEKYNQPDQGIHLLDNSGQVQFASNPDNTEIVQELLHDETTGELTKPSLETLTIIAYRQPIAKEELEQIRGVNCSLILRNLLIRGLVDMQEIKGGLSAVYSVTMEFLRFLGINSVEELPNYTQLNCDENLQSLLARGKGNSSASADGGTADNLTLTV